MCSAAMELVDATLKMAENECTPDEREVFKRLMRKSTTSHRMVNL